MANTILASEIRKGTEIILRDGRPATVMDNRVNSISRDIETVAVFGPWPCRGAEYIREWSCLKDGTRITFTDAQRQKLARVRASGF